MTLDISPSQLVSLASTLSALHRRERKAAYDVLADIGLLVSGRSDGGWEFETLIDRAKRMVLEELHKCVTK